VSLINEALQRARAEAARQQAAQLQGSAPPPAFQPAPMRRRERSLALLGAMAGLGVSVLVGGLFLLWRETRVEPKVSAIVKPAPAAVEPSPTTGAETRSPTPNESPQRQATAQPHSVVATSRVAQEPSPVTRVPAALSPNPASAPATKAVEPTTVAPKSIASASNAPGNTVTLPNGAHIELGGIIWGADPIAMLNGKPLGVGEYIEGLAVVRIERARVALRGDAGTFVLDLR
jgi:hypothetical protein